MKQPRSLTGWLVQDLSSVRLAGKHGSASLRVIAGEETRYSGGRTYSLGGQRDANGCERDQAEAGDKRTG